jgi:RNA polymerase sigma factor (sigma-70 family)
MDGAPGALVRRATSGDQEAWARLVERYNSMVWSIVRSFRLGGDGSYDAVQTVWLRLVESLHRVRDPDAIGTWLATTARNVCLSELRRQGRRALPVDTSDREIVDVRAAPPDNQLIMTERDRALWAALDRISQRCRQLLRVLAADPPPSYQEAAVVLAMPVGSIGPTRARCLEKLRQLIATDLQDQDLLGSP